MCSLENQLAHVIPINQISSLEYVLLMSTIYMHRSFQFMVVGHYFHATVACYPIRKYVLNVLACVWSLIHFFSVHLCPLFHDYLINLLLCHNLILNTSRNHLTVLRHSQEGEFISFDIFWGVKFSPLIWGTMHHPYSSCITKVLPNQCQIQSKDVSIPHSFC